MSNETITRSRLIDVVYKETGVTRSEATLIFDVMLEAISKLLKQDGEVKINKFGTFSCKRKAERVGRNPKTGQEVKIPAHNSVAFKPATNFKVAVEQTQFKLAA
jgi:integration host factor subunit alpha